VSAALISHTVNRLWASPDIWMWAASIREFGDRPLDPQNPLRPGDSADPYLSPYSFVLGRLSQVVDVSPLTMLAAAAVVNLAVLLVAFRRLALSHGNRWMPACLLATTLLAWGIQPWRWSGFFSANSIGTVLPLGSTSAAAVAILMLASIASPSSATVWARRFFVIAAGSAYVVLVHPMTFVGAVCVMCGLGVGTTRTVNVRVAIAVAAGVAAALLWPFVSWWELARSSAFDDANDAMFARVAQRTFLAWPAALLAWRRLRADDRDPLAWAMVIPTVVYLAAWATGRGDLGRVLPWAMLAAHLLLATWLSERLCSGLGDGRRSKFALAALGAVGVVGCAPGVARAVPDMLRVGPLSDAVTDSVVVPWSAAGPCPAGVIVAERSVAVALSALCGDVLWAPVPEVFGAGDEAARRAATDSMLAVDADVERLRGEFGVRWLAVPASDGPALVAALDQHGVRSGAVLVVGDASLVELLPAGAPGAEPGDG
jgi:hypothetical protein